MSAQVDKQERQRLEELSSRLRAAAWSAMEQRPTLARSLDESRGEIERLLMLSTVDGFELRRALLRAEMVLDAWRNWTVDGSSHV